MPASISEVFPKNEGIIVGYSLVIVACALLMVVVQLEEYAVKKSFRGCFTRFHIWCLTILGSTAFLAGTDILYLQMLSTDTFAVKGSVLASNNLFVTLTIGTYSVYIFNRSKAVLWKYQVAGVWAKRFVNLNYVFFVLVVVSGTLGTLVLAARYISMVFSAISGLIVVGLDVFYTYIFVVEVKATKAQIHVRNSETIIIANYGLLCLAFSFASFACYVVNLALVYAASVTAANSFLVGVRVFMFLVGFGMFLMKYKLNRFSAGKAKQTSTVVASNVARMSKSTPERQNSSKLSAMTHSGVESDLETQASKVEEQADFVSASVGTSAVNVASVETSAANLVNDFLTDDGSAKGTAFSSAAELEPKENMV